MASGSSRVVVVGEGEHVGMLETIKNTFDSRNGRQSNNNTPVVVAVAAAAVVVVTAWEHKY